MPTIVRKKDEPKAPIHTETPDPRQCVLQVQGTRPGTELTLRPCQRPKAKQTHDLARPWGPKCPALLRETPRSARPLVRWESRQGPGTGEQGAHGTTRTLPPGAAAPHVRETGPRGAHRQDSLMETKCPPGFVDLINDPKCLSATEPSLLLILQSPGNTQNSEAV